MRWRMYLSSVFERFVQNAPICVMARAAMEHALAPEALDALFDEHADRQYTRELLFSSVVDLMGVVVARIQPSVHAAYQSVKVTLPASVQAVYDKLACTEPGIAAALVGHTAERLAPVIRAMAGTMPAFVPGYRVRIVDGNHLAATERRLKVLRQSVAGPLPGHALVVLDPELMLAMHMIGCEDGHAEANRRCWFERSVEDDDMKFGHVVLRVQAPPGQSLASRPVASLAAVPVTGRLMRR
jgi:hypothetical protein